MEDGTELVFMGIEGPADLTTEELLTRAAKMLGIPRKAIEIEDEVGPGSVCFNAAMPAGYYDEHEDGLQIQDGACTVGWEKP